MLTITIRTDKPEAEIGLFDNEQQVAYYTWEAHRHLAETLHQKIADILAGTTHELHDIEAVLVFAGPGSFTGLRIGITVANALSYSLHVPILATEDDDWIKTGLTRLLAGESSEIALPEYGSLPHITPQKK